MYTSHSSEENIYHITCYVNNYCQTVNNENVDKKCTTKDNYYDKQNFSTFKDSICHIIRMHCEYLYYITCTNAVQINVQRINIDYIKGNKTMSN